MNTLPQQSQKDVVEALVAMVYVHECNCGDGIPQGQCARCRAVKVLGFDPAVLRPVTA